MTLEEALEYLKDKYPDKEIIVQKQGKSIYKLIADIEPTRDHPGWSEVVSFIFDSEPHYHKKTTEVYTVLKGELELHVDGKVIQMVEGDSHLIPPGQIHYGKSKDPKKGALIACRMTPGWSREDHVTHSVP